MKLKHKNIKHKEGPFLMFYVFTFFVLPLSLTSCDQKRLQFPQFFAGFARSIWGICSDRKRFISTGASAANDALSVLEKDPQGIAPTRVGDRSMAGAKTLYGYTNTV